LIESQKRVDLSVKIWSKSCLGVCCYSVWQLTPRFRSRSIQCFI